MADDRLDEQAGERRGDPERGQRFEFGAERLEDAAHIGILQREADLDSQKAEADVPQAAKALCRLFHISLPGGAGAARGVTIAARGSEGKPRGWCVYEYVRRAS